MACTPLSWKLLGEPPLFRLAHPSYIRCTKCRVSLTRPYVSIVGLCSRSVPNRPRGLSPDCDTMPYCVPPHCCLDAVSTFGELTMRQPEQIALLKRLLHFVETKTTCMAETPYRNPVTTYTDPARLAREQRGLFHPEPLLTGFASG